MIVLVALICAAVVLAIASLNWRWSIKSVLVVTVIEGGLRKWVLPEASELIYFLKDGILLGAYLGYILEYNVPTKLFLHRPVLLCAVGMLAFVVVLQILNPLLGSVLVGLLGAKGYLFYLPLALVLPKLFTTVDQLGSYLRWFVLICIPVGILGIVQFFSPVDSFINVYAPSATELISATFGEEGNVRVTGTFPYIVGFSIFVVLCLALNYALLAHLRSWVWRGLFLGMQLLLGVDLLMTGSRGAAISAVGLWMGFIVFSLFERTKRSRGLGVFLAAMGVLCFFVAAASFSSALEAFRQRATESGDSMSGRIIQALAEPVYAIDQGGLLGYGTGACQVACMALREQLHLGPPMAYPPPAEGEPFRVMLEIGVVGFLCWYTLRIYLLVTLASMMYRLRNPMLRHLALAALMMHALFIIGQLVTNTTFSIFYWFLSGFVFLFPELDWRWQRAQRRVVRKLPVVKNQPVPVLGVKAGV